MRQLRLRSQIQFYRGNSMKALIQRLALSTRRSSPDGEQRFCGSRRARSVMAAVVFAAISTTATESRAAAAIVSNGPEESSHSAPWTTADFIATWGVPPVGNAMSTVLMSDASLELSELGAPLELECPEFYWVGMQMSAEAGVDATIGIAGNSGLDQFDGLGTFTDFLLVPLPRVGSTFTVDAEHPDYGSVVITVTEAWIGGTLVGTTGVPQHITALLSMLTVEGTNLPDGRVGALVLTPHRKWRAVEDVYAELWLMSQVYSAAGESALIANGRRSIEPPEILSNPASCEEERAYGRWLCHITKIEARAACHTTYRTARIAADAALIGCLNGVTLQERMKKIGEGIHIGSCIGAGIGSCVGAILGSGAGGIGALPGGLAGGAFGFTGGACIGGSSEQSAEER